MDLLVKEVDEGLKKLEYLSLVSKVCGELESNLGLEDKVLAEFIIEMGRNSEEIEDFAAQLKQLGVRMPKYFVPMLFTDIHAIFPSNPNSKSSFPGLEISDARKRFEKLEREIKTKTKGQDTTDKGERRSGRDNEERDDGDKNNDGDNDSSERKNDGGRQDRHGRDGFEEDRADIGDDGTNRETRYDKPKLYQVYKGRVSRVFQTGCFVQLGEFPGNHMVHVSQMATGRRIYNAREVVKRHQEVHVKVIYVSDLDFGLSMRDVDQNIGEDLRPLNDYDGFRTDPLGSNSDSGIRISEEDVPVPSRRPLQRINSPDIWEDNQLVAAGVISSVKENPMYNEEGDGQRSKLSTQDQRESLPIAKLKNQLIQDVHDNQVLVGIGETGSGKTTQLEHLPAMVAGARADDGNLQLEATSQFRKLLSIERSPPIKEVIQTGVIPGFVEFLAREVFPQLQAVWALGNVAGDSAKCRDLVLGHGALLPLLLQLNEHAKLSMLNATWTLSNFCRGKPQAAFDQTMPALPALQCLIHSDDDEVLTDACWAVSCLLDGTNDKIQAVIDAVVCPRLVELSLHPSPSVLIPALRMVGNIVTGDDMQTQCIINHQSLPCLANLLASNHKKSIKKEACWTILNITAGNNDQVQAAIEANIFGPLVHLLRNAEFEIKKEASWAIPNATSGRSRKRLHGRSRKRLHLLGSKEGLVRTEIHHSSSEMFCLTFCSTLTEACWTISNITAGNNGQVQAAIEANIFGPLVHRFQNAEFEIKKEASWVISNATSGGTHKQIKYLFSQAYIMLCDLVCPDPRIVTICSEGLVNILKVGEFEKLLGHSGDVNLSTQMIEDANGLEKIGNLESHDNTEIYEEEVKLLETYCLKEDDEPLPLVVQV